MFRNGPTSNGPGPGRSCLIDDDEEKEVLQFGNDWVKKEDGITDHSTSTGKAAVHHDLDRVNKKKQKKKWIHFPLDDVGLSYSNPRLSQHEQRAQRSSPSSFPPFNVSNAWKDKKGSELFMKKTIDEEFVTQQEIQAVDVKVLEADVSCASSTSESQHTLSEEELLMMKAVKESIMTHKKEEENRHKKMLIDIANLSEDEKIGCEKTGCRHEHSFEKRYKRCLDDKKKSTSDCNNNNSNLSSDEFSRMKSHSTKQGSLNSRLAHKLLSNEDIKFKSVSIETDIEQLTEGTFRLNTMTFNNSNSRNYNNKSVDSKNQTDNVSKRYNTKSQNPRDSNVKYTGILKNSSRKSVSKCSGETTSDFGENCSNSEEVKHVKNVHFKMGKEEVQTCEEKIDPLAEKSQNAVKIVSSIIENTAESLFCTTDVSSKVFKESSSEIQRKTVRFEISEPPGNSSFFTQTEECLNFDPVHSKSSYSGIGDSQSNKEEEIPKEETMVNNFVSTSQPVLSVRLVDSVNSCVPPLMCNNNSMNSIWLPAPQSIENNLIPETIGNGRDPCQIVPQLTYENNSFYPNPLILTQENSNSSTVNSVDNVDRGHCSSIDLNELSYRNAISEIMKMNEKEIVNYVTSRVMNEHSVTRSLNSAGLQPPPGFVAVQGRLQQNPVHPGISVPFNEDVQQSLNVQIPGPVLTDQQRPQLPSNLKNGIWNSQNYNHVKEMVHQFVNQFPEVKVLKDEFLKENNNITSDSENNLPPLSTVPAQPMQQPPPMFHQMPVAYYHQVMQMNDPSLSYTVPIQNPQVINKVLQSRTIQLHNQPSHQIAETSHNVLLPPSHVGRVLATQPSLPSHVSPAQLLNSCESSQSTQSSELQNHQFSLTDYLVRNQHQPSPSPDIIQLQSCQTKPVPPQSVRQTLPLTPPVSQISQLDYLQSQGRLTQDVQMKSQQIVQPPMFSYACVPPAQFSSVIRLQNGQVLQQLPVIPGSVYHQGEGVQINNHKGPLLSTNSLNNPLLCNTSMNQNQLLQGSEVNKNNSLNDGKFRSVSDVVNSLESSSPYQFLQDSFIDQSDSNSSIHDIRDKTLYVQQNHGAPIVEQYQKTGVPILGTINGLSVGNNQKERQSCNDTARFIPGQMVPCENAHPSLEQRRPLVKNYIESKYNNNLESRGRGRLKN